MLIPNAKKIKKCSKAAANFVPKYCYVLIIIICVQFHAKRMSKGAKLVSIVTNRFNIN